ncbi:hypothetical protein HKCCE2091_13405 [Rhodobacterales bacterium HKCCE2091]|nr:hypothetical protein [Rhodobacterales bacterium HKCCE2091]
MPELLPFIAPQAANAPNRPAGPTARDTGDRDGAFAALASEPARESLGGTNPVAREGEPRHNRPESERAEDSTPSDDPASVAGTHGDTTPEIQTFRLLSASTLDAGEAPAVPSAPVTPSIEGGEPVIAASPGTDPNRQAVGVDVSTPRVRSETSTETRSLPAQDRSLQSVLVTPASGERQEVAGGERTEPRIVLPGTNVLTSEQADAGNLGDDVPKSDRVPLVDTRPATPTATIQPAEVDDAADLPTEVRVNPVNSGNRVPTAGDGAEEKIAVRTASPPDRLVEPEIDDPETDMDLQADMEPEQITSRDRPDSASRPERPASGNASVSAVQNVAAVAGGQTAVQSASQVEAEAAIDDVLTLAPLHASTPIASTAPGAAPAQIAQAATGQIAAALPRADGVIVTDRGTEVALDPPELGRVRMIVTETAGGLALTITAERQETLDLLRRHAAMLNAEFQREGLANTSFSFAGEPGGDGAGRGSEQQARVNGPAAGFDGPAPQPARIASAHRGALDLRL